MLPLTPPVAPSVTPPAGTAGHEGVDVVAADPSEQGGEAARDLVGFAGAECAHAANQVGVVIVSVNPAKLPDTSPNRTALPPARIALIAWTLCTMLP